MEAVIKIATIHNELLEEDTLDVVFEAGEVTYIGALFFKKDDIEEITEVLEEKTVNGSVLEVILTAYEMMKAHDLIAEDDQTLKTMLHWQYINGFSRDMISEACPYRHETDTVLLEELRANGCIK